MSVYASNTWGDTDSNDKACIGLWFYETANSGTSYTFRADAWIWTKWAIHDSDNNWYWNRSTSSSVSATTNYGSVSIYTTNSSGSSWSTTNQQKLDSGSYSYDKGHSAYYVYIAIKLTNVYGCGTMTHTGWVQIPAKSSYTVAYNANGGSGAPGSQTKWYGENLTLSSTKPTRTGYSFAGWNTNSSGTGTNYSSGGSYTSNSGVTLYAKWTPNTYTISYNANGGSGQPGNQTKTYGVNLTLSTTKPSRTGYTFKNWNTASNGSGTPYNSGGTYSTNAGATLYAQWTANTYYVKYNGNGSTSGSMSNSTHTYGAAKALTSNAYSKTGYTFKGWSTSKTATSATYTNGQSVSNLTATAGGTVELFAIWQANTYTVAFNNNASRYGTSDITGSMANTTFTYDTPQALPANAYVWDYHQFKGWATSADGNVAYNDGQQISTLATGGTTTLYAIWEELYHVPIVSIASCYRSDENGDLADSGGYAHFDFSYEVDTNIHTDNVATKYEIKYKLRTATTYTTLNSTIISGTSGALNWTTADEVFDDESAYDIKIEVTDKYGVGYSFGFISISYFTVDFRSGGRGIAFGCSATKDDTLRSAMNTEFMGSNLSSTNYYQDTPLSSSATPTENIYSNGFYVTSPSDGGNWCYTRAMKLSDGRQGIQLESRRSVNDTWKYNTINLLIDDSGNKTVMLSDPKAWLSALSLSIYPVGSIYMSVNSTNPGTLFGGTWEQLQNRFLLGAGTSYSNGATGGAASVTLTAAQSGVPAHSHGHTLSAASKTLTGDISPYGDTGLLSGSYKVSGVFAKGANTYSSYKLGYASGSSYSLKIDASHGHTLSGSISNNTAANASQAHENMPPYLVVYMWKRTA